MSFFFPRFVSIILIALIVLPIIAVAQPCEDWYQAEAPNLNGSIGVDRLLGWNDVLVTADTGVTTWNVDDPQNPVLLDSVVLPGAEETLNLRRHGDRVYAACGNAGLYWVDLVDPADLAIAGSWNPGHPVIDAAGYGDLVVTMAGDGTVAVVDPTTATVLGSVDVPYPLEGFSVAVTGDYALASYTWGLMTIDLSVPTAPFEAADLHLFAPPVTSCPVSPSNPSFEDLVIDGDTAYAVSYQLFDCIEEFEFEVGIFQRMLVSLDLSNLPYVTYHEVRHLDEAAAVDLAGDHVVAAGDGIMVVDRDPGIALATSFATGSDFLDVCVLEGTIFATSGAALLTAPLTIVENPGPLNFVEAPGAMAASDRFRLFVQSFQGGSERLEYDLYDLGQWETLPVIYHGSFHYDGNFGTASIPMTAVGESRVMITHAQDLEIESVRVIDTDSGEDGEMPWVFPMPNGAFQGNLYWSMEWESTTLAVWDLNDVHNITQLGSWELDAAGSFLLNGSTLLQDRETSLLPIDLSNFAAPVIHEPVAVTHHGSYGAVAFAGDLMISTSGNHLEVIDVGDPAAVAVRGDLALGLGVFPRLAADGDIAVIAASHGVFQVVSLADPDHPTPLGEPVAVSARSLVLDGDLLYVAVAGGVRLFDLTDPASPIEVGMVAGPTGAAGSLIHGQTLITGSAVYPLHCQTTAATDPLPMSRNLLGPVAPNPFNPMTTIRFALPTLMPVDLTVHDLRGRRVRILLSDSLPAGPHTAAWNGCDDAGRDLASGVYFVRLATPGGVEVTKAVLVR